MANHSAHITRDPDEIIGWVEERGGRPAVVRRSMHTRGRHVDGILRIDFPANGPEPQLEPITWDDFFDVFDRRGLMFLYQDRTADGEASYFNKFIREDIDAPRAQRRAPGRAGTAGARGGRAGRSTIRSGRRTATSRRASSARGRR